MSERWLSFPGPSRTVDELENGNFEVKVVPPSWARVGGGTSVVLTPDQYRRYLDWRAGGVLIQKALPDLSMDEREILISGMNDRTFKAYVGSEDEE